MTAMIFFISGLNSTILCLQTWGVLILNSNGWAKRNPEFRVKSHLTGNRDQHNLLV